MPRLSLVALSLPVIAAPLALAGSAPPTALIRVNDDLGADGIVTGIGNPAVNHVGGWSFGIDSGGLDRFWGAPAGGLPTVLRTQMQIDNLDQTSFEAFNGLADDGTQCYSALSTNIDTGTTGLDGIWYGDMVVALEEEPAAGLPGLFYSFGSRPGVGSSVPWGIVGLTDTQGGSTQARGIIKGTAANLVFMEGDALFGLPAPVTQIDFDTRFSRSATQYMAPVNVDLASTEDGTLVRSDDGLEIDGILVREGTSVPASAGGLPGENWDNFDFVGITDSGTYMFTGDTDGDIATDEFVLVNDQIVLREGTIVDDQVVSGAIESGYMNDNGDWAVVWDLNANSTEALFVNGDLILAESQAIDFDGDGSIDLGTAITEFTGIASLAVSDRDGSVVRVYCTANVDTGGGEIVEVGLCVTVQVSTVCACDFDGDFDVDVDDLLVVLGNWGGPGGDCTGDGTTDVNDLLQLLGDWGPCL